MLVAVDSAPPPAAFSTALKMNAAEREATPSPAINPSSDVATREPLFPRRTTNMKATKQRGKKPR